MTSGNGKNPKILVLPHEPGLADFLRQLLAAKDPRVPLVILTQAPTEVVSALLRRDGHDTVVTANGQEAFLLAQESHPHYVLLDAAVLEIIVNEWREAQGRLDALAGFLPMCSQCKKIRRPDAGWETIESYLGRQLALEFTPTLCPEHLEASGAG